MNIDNFISHIDDSVVNADLEKSLLSNNPEILKIPGMSQRKNRHLMNNLANFEGLSYLEVGLYKGSTFISALAGNEKKILEATGIDNWCEFQNLDHILDGNIDPNLSIKDQFVINFNKYIDVEDKNINPLYNINLYDSNCWTFDKSLIKNKVNFFFYDGCHSYDDQYNAYRYFDSVLDNVFLTVIDDWECPSKYPKMGTLDAFTDLGYIPHLLVRLPAGIPDAYHGGVAIALIEKK